MAACKASRCSKFESLPVKNLNDEPCPPIGKKFVETLTSSHGLGLNHAKAKDDTCLKTSKCVAGPLSIITPEQFLVPPLLDAPSAFDAEAATSSNDAGEITFFNARDPKKVVDGAEPGGTTTFSVFNCCNFGSQNDYDGFNVENPWVRLPLQRRTLVFGVRLEKLVHSGGLTVSNKNPATARLIIEVGDVICAEILDLWGQTIDPIDAECGQPIQGTAITIRAVGKQDIHFSLCEIRVHGIQY